LLKTKSIYLDSLENKEEYVIFIKVFNLLPH